MKLRFLVIVLCVLAVAYNVAAKANENTHKATQNNLYDWYKISLLLVRHTPTYTPPVASRSLAYLGIAAFEVEASGDVSLVSLAGQLHGLKALPQRQKNESYDDTIIMNATMGSMVKALFSNTGPTGQRVLAAMLANTIPSTADEKTQKRSADFGAALAAHILRWAENDGGAKIDNMGFPETYELTAAPGHWVPTGAIRLQQHPLLPGWGSNRSFAMPQNADCALPIPPAYSEDRGSEFFNQALEVYNVKNSLTDEQRRIARFWSDDAMLTVTPPGHWVSIAWQIIVADKIDLRKTVDVLARLGIAEADAFIGCWQRKFQFDQLRPVTYIRKLIDPKWDALLITPPFPEYPSGHSVISGAAATVMAFEFGEHYAFTDATGSRDGLAKRKFENFAAAANEAGISRLYGGIHFRAAIEDGLAQGRCIGKFATDLRLEK
jgi:PAP2 superfamily